MSDAPKLDTRHAHSARVYNYWLGGKDNFAADRDAAEQAIAANPEIVADARANRVFLARAVRFLAAECGVRQFLDIGAGLPTANNTHEVAQAVAPDARIVYVDNDPMVLLHARALLTGIPKGAPRTSNPICATPGHHQGGGRDPGLRRAGRAHAAHHLAPDPGRGRSVRHRGHAGGRVAARQLPGARPPGQRHPRREHGGDDQAGERADARAARATMRDRAAVSRFFDGLELVEPGVVQPQQWRPEPGVSARTR